MFKFSKRPADTLFRNRPRTLSTEDMNKLAGAGPFAEKPGLGGSKAPYDMDYATRTFN